jgi:hydrogenase maturation protease
MDGSVMVIGVGNAFRGDDQTGLEVVRRLGDLDGQIGITVHAHEGTPVGLLDLWDGAEAVVLVDSMRSGVAPGSITRIDATTEAIPLPLGSASSHAVGVAEAIELARALEILPSTVVVYGVEGASYEAGAPLTESVAAVIKVAAGDVRREALELLARP